MKTEKTGRTLCIGDVHGNAKGLQQVLDKCNWNPEEDKIIQLGDVSDGWSETSECVDILLDIKHNSENEPIFIRGNHDVWVYDWMMFGLTPSIWTTQGGKATLESYVRTGKLEDRKHRNFWFNQKDWYIDEESRVFIHAGWAYREKPNAEEMYTPLQEFEKMASLPMPPITGSIARECHWDRTLLEGAKSSRVSQDSFKATRLFKEVYIGHTATKEHKVENHGNLWNMDSGSGWYGRLSIMDIDTKEIWYSDFSKELYPNEKGR